eukprot:6212330-Pleurochrysis_carterae.AAC.3
MEGQISDCRGMRETERTCRGGVAECVVSLHDALLRLLPELFNDAEARCCRYFPAEKFCHPRDNLSATPQMYKIKRQRSCMRKSVSKNRSTNMS